MAAGAGAAANMPPPPNGAGAGAPNAVVQSERVFVFVRTGKERVNT